MSKAQKRIWFKAKNYGWGWYPATWQGWVLIFLYAATVLALFYGVEESASFSDAPLQRALVGSISATIILIFISYKTGEKPSWRWGDKTKNTPKK